MSAFEKVNREDFVHKDKRQYAYEDIALLIGFDQTISQPQTIAFMLELLELEDKQKILEIGCGSGYILTLIDVAIKNSEIYGTEIVKKLAEFSEKSIGHKDNVNVFYTPYTLGLPEHQLYDRIILSAASQNFTDSLVDQLKEGGIVIFPVKNSIIKVKKQGGKGVLVEEYYGFTFVLLIEKKQIIDMFLFNN